MKPLFILILICFSTCAVRADQNITAIDIAKHLGIHSWRFDKSKLPSVYYAKLVVIINGELSENLTGRVIFNQDSDLVVSASLTNASMRVSASNKNFTETTVSQKIVNRENWFESTSTNQEIILGKPLILAADYRIVGNIKSFSQKVDDVVAGLAIIFDKHEPK